METTNVQNAAECTNTQKVQPDPPGSDYSDNIGYN